jgi:putative SOS response-associated peptidase YedK
MCGRYKLITMPEILAAIFHAARSRRFPPSRNIAPTDIAPVVRQHAGARTIDLLRWGLVPPWTQDPSIGARLINARSEDADATPAFRSAFQRRRCLVPADGFYEWQAVPGRKRKRPYDIRLRSGAPFAFAGLWERWSRDGQELETFCILTTDSNDLVRPIHDRMPVILHPEDHAAWLDETAESPATLKAMLRSYEPDAMEATPIADPAARASTGLFHQGQLEPP